MSCPAFTYMFARFKKNNIHLDLNYFSSSNTFLTDKTLRAFHCSILISMTCSDMLYPLVQQALTFITGAPYPEWFLGLPLGEH